MKKSFFIAAIAAATVLLTGCSQEDGMPSVNNDANAIEFRGVVDKTTRATAVGSTAELTNFFVQAGAHATAATIADLNFMEAPVYKQGSSAWTYAPAKYYPTNGDEVNFYAYAPIKDVNMTTDMNIVSGKAQFGYTVPANQKVNNTAVDLLVANADNQVATTVPAPVAFTFNHALSAVSFSAANRNPVTGNGSELTYVISDIRITKMDNVGTFDYPFSATSWISAGTRSIDYVAGLPEAGVALTAIGAAPAPAQSLLSANDLMMVLPQTVTAGTLDVDGAVIDDETFVVVTYSFRDGAGAPIVTNAERLLTLPASFQFEAGTRYNFEFEFGGANDPMNAITFTVTEVTDWNNIGTDLPQ